MVWQSSRVMHCALYGKSLMFVMYVECARDVRGMYARRLNR